MNDSQSMTVGEMADAQGPGLTSENAFTYPVNNSVAGDESGVNSQYSMKGYDILESVAKESTKKGDAGLSPAQVPGKPDSGSSPTMTIADLLELVKEKTCSLQQYPKMLLITWDLNAQQIRRSAMI